jgi:transposase-like protein
MNAPGFVAMRDSQAAGSTGGAGQDDGQKLVQFLQSHIATLLSPDADPVPPCPKCKGRRIRKKGYARLRTGPLPTYQCEHCGHYFSRLTGTPLTHRPFRLQVDELVALLPQPLSCSQVARDLGVMKHTVRETVRLVRSWLQELDPDGHYVRLIRLGSGLDVAQTEVPDAGVDAEDPLLTDRLTHDFDAVHSPHSDPLPICPRCGCRNVRRRGRVSGLPRYCCTACGKQFNRRTGTPFTRNHDAARQRALIRCLGLPLPLLQLAEMIGADPAITARLVDEFRARCMHLDPSGQLASRIRACVRPAADTPCVRCGERQVRFDVPGIPHARCIACGRLISMRRQLVERNGILYAGPWQAVAIDADP